MCPVELQSSRHHKILSSTQLIDGPQALAPAPSLTCFPQMTIVVKGRVLKTVAYRPQQIGIRLESRTWENSTLIVVDFTQDSISATRK